MPTLNELKMLIDQPDAARLAAWVVGFAAWSLAIWAIAQAVFRSWPAQSFQKWLWTDEAKAGTLRRLAWEIHNSMEYAEDVAHGQQLKQGIALSPAEVEARRQQYLELARVTLPKRIISYLLSCGFCQHFWIAAVLVGGSVVSPWNIISTGFAYAGLATLTFADFKAKAGTQTPKPGRCPGGDCLDR